MGILNHIEANIELLKFAATIVGALAAATAAWVAWNGFKGVNETVRREIVSALFTQNAQARALIAATPRFRKYFFENVEIPFEHDDYGEVRTIAEIYLNYLEHLAIEKKSLETDTEVETWNNTVMDMLYRSPIMREIIYVDKGWYAKELQDAAKEAMLKSIEKPYKRQVYVKPTVQNIESWPLP